MDLGYCTVSAIRVHEEALDLVHCTVSALEMHEEVCGAAIGAKGIALGMATRALGLKVPSLDLVVIGWVLTVRGACEAVVGMGGVGTSLIGEAESKEVGIDTIWDEGASIKVWAVGEDDKDWSDKGC